MATLSPPTIDYQLLMSTPYGARGGFNTGAPTDAAGAPVVSGVAGEPFVLIAGFLLLLFGLHVLTTREKAGYELAHIKIWSGYNWLAVTITAMFGFMLFKLVFNLIRIPYVTDLVNFV